MDEFMKWNELGDDVIWVQDMRLATVGGLN